MEELDAIVIGAGPAGLMAAQMLAEAGRQVTIIEAKPSPARKFLMAGKSGLNLSKDEGFEKLLPHFEEAKGHLKPMLEAFDSKAVMQWARDLDQDIFTGSSGRVFPVCMKASPLLRAWLAKLEAMGTSLRKNWLWQGFDTDSLVFETPDGTKKVQAQVTVLALGGASWSRLGSDGQWVAMLKKKGVLTKPLVAANVGLKLDWSSHMEQHFGAPVKSTALSAGPARTRGEFVITASGLEGGGIYSLSKAIREGHELTLDLYPDKTVNSLMKKINRPRGKNSLSNHLRKSIGLSGAKMALLREFVKPLPCSEELAHQLKNLIVPHAGPVDIEKAISSAGGLSFDAVDNNLMIKSLPGIFCAGEMLDWEAPTGGYLLTACLATGRWAGIAAASYK